MLISRCKSQTPAAVKLAFNCVLIKNIAVAKVEKHEEIEWEIYEVAIRERARTLADCDFEFIWSGEL